MNKKETLKLLTDNFGKTQNKLIEKTVEDIISVLNMVEAINLIGTCNDDKFYLQKVSVESLSESLDYYFDQLKIYCADIKSTIEAIEIATNLLQEENKNESKN